MKCLFSEGLSTILFREGGESDEIGVYEIFWGTQTFLRFKGVNVLG